MASLLFHRDLHLDIVIRPSRYAFHFITLLSFKALPNIYINSSSEPSGANKESVKSVDSDYGVSLLRFNHVLFSLSSKKEHH